MAGPAPSTADTTALMSASATASGPENSSLFPAKIRIRGRSRRRPRWWFGPDQHAAKVDIRAKPRTRQVAVVLGVGGTIDIFGNNFPPHQASLMIGAEYRGAKVVRGALTWA